MYISNKIIEEEYVFKNICGLYFFIALLHMNRLPKIKAMTF